jgi:hypothetical protein
MKIGAVKAILQGYYLHSACIFYLLLKMVHSCELSENWCSENHCLLYDVIHLCLNFPHLLRDLVELWYKVSEHNAVSICEFHENWHRKDCTSLMDVNEIAFMHVLCTTWYFEINRFLGNVSVLCHGIHDFRTCDSYSWRVVQ